MIFSRFLTILFSDPKVKLKAAVTNSGGKKTVVTNAINTVDSGTGAVCYTQQPEKETIISMNKIYGRTSSNLKKCTKTNDKQITNDTNNGENYVFDKHRNNCDNFFEKCVSSNDMNTMILGSDDKMNENAVTYLYSDNFDDDPYAELQSYLEKVKVSLISFLSLSLSFLHQSAGKNFKTKKK